MAKKGKDYEKKFRRQQSRNVYLAVLAVILMFMAAAAAVVAMTGVTWYNHETTAYSRFTDPLWDKTMTWAFPSLDPRQAMTQIITVKSVKASTGVQCEGADGEIAITFDPENIKDTLEIQTPKSMGPGSVLTITDPDNWARVFALKGFESEGDRNAAHYALLWSHHQDLVPTGRDYFDVLKAEILKTASEKSVCFRVAPAELAKQRTDGNTQVFPAAKVKPPAMPDNTAPGSTSPRGAAWQAVPANKTAAPAATMTPSPTATAEYVRGKNKDDLFLEKLRAACATAIAAMNSEADAAICEAVGTRWSLSGEPEDAAIQRAVASITQDGCVISIEKATWQQFVTAGTPELAKARELASQFWVYRFVESDPSRLVLLGAPTTGGNFAVCIAELSGAPGEAEGKQWQNAQNQVTTVDSPFSQDGRLRGGLVSFAAIPETRNPIGDVNSDLYPDYDLMGSAQIDGVYVFPVLIKREYGVPDVVPTAAMPTQAPLYVSPSTLQQNMARIGSPEFTLDTLSGGFRNYPTVVFDWRGAPVTVELGDLANKYLGVEAKVRVTTYSMAQQPYWFEYAGLWWYPFGDVAEPTPAPSPVPTATPESQTIRVEDLRAYFNQRYPGMGVGILESDPCSAASTVMVFHSGYVQIPVDLTAAFNAQAPACTYNGKVGINLSGNSSSVGKGWKYVNPNWEKGESGFQYTVGPLE